MQISRRNFTGGVTALALAGFANQSSLAQSGKVRIANGYGPLKTDPHGLIDLPEGFSYRVISQFGDRMSDGYNVPDRADGMGCFAMPDGRIALVRNHELKVKNDETGPFIDNKWPDAGIYDRRVKKEDAAENRPLVGGTTTLILDASGQRVERQHLSLVGTIRNCSGGTTPWGSWLSCEEDVTKAGDGVGRDHGWVFEVPAAHTGLVDPVPLKAMGRFNHEAAAVDPVTGIVYLTEDRDDSLFYRFIPNVRGDLQKGGKLQALGFLGSNLSQDTRNWSAATFAPQSWKGARWISLENVKSPDDDLRKRGAAKGAAIFARGEGIIQGADDNGRTEFYFCCTSGGAAKEGQIMRYRPSKNEGKPAKQSTPALLQLFMESTSQTEYSFGDNLTVAPNGDLVVCEDQYSAIVNNHLRGVTPAGEVYPLAKIRVQTEPAGACFSPDGNTLFINLYSPAKTLAIKGPWVNT